MKKKKNKKKLRGYFFKIIGIYYVFKSKVDMDSKGPINKSINKLYFLTTI